MIFIKRSTWFFVFVLLTACTSESVDKKTQDSNSQIEEVSQKPVSKDSKDDILARVNGSTITRSELAYAMNRLLPKGMSDIQKEKLSGKVLDSLIDSRLMADLEASTMSEHEHKELETKVSAYREELLVKQYITKNITPNPVTAEKIHQYYLDHPHEFGGGTEKTFEIIEARENLDEAERKQLLIEFAGLKGVNNWANWFADTKLQKVSYKQSTLLVELLDESLKKIVVNTKDGETSPVLNNKKIRIVRVNQSKQLPAKPIDQVSRKIRRKLAPQALKVSIKNHLVDLKKKASIEKSIGN